MSGERCDRLATTTSPSSGFGRTCISLAFDKVENNASMSSIILSSGAIYFSYALLSNVKNKRFNAGAYTMPLTGALLSIKPIFTVKSVRLLINSLVPSSGSRRKNLSSIVSGKPFSELSSPIIWILEKCDLIPRIIISSPSRSAMVTGESLLLVSTTISLWKYTIAFLPAFKAKEHRK